MNEFEKDYFKTAYGGDYEKRNPLKKLRYYLRKIREIKLSGDLLDIGCAYGLFLSVAEKSYNVAGCDISAHAVKEAKNRFPNIDVFQSSLETLKTDRTFDIVTCFDILEHVGDLDKAIEKLKGLLKKEGIVVLTIPVYDTIVGRVVGVLDKDETHVWKRGRDFWRDKLRAHGIKLLKDIGLWRYCLAKRYYIFFGGRVWRNFSPAILLIGQRDDIHSSSCI